MFHVKQGTVRATDWKQLWDLDRSPLPAELYEETDAPWDLLESDSFKSALGQIADKAPIHFRGEGLVQHSLAISRDKIIRDSNEPGKPQVRAEKMSQCCKGELKVYFGDKLLEGACYIEAGSYLAPGCDIWFGLGCYIQSSSYLEGEIVFGPSCSVRNGAFIRAGLIAGSGVMIGHASEIKASILHSQSSVPHFGYVGDSILGSGVNLGAGTKISNLKIAGSTIRIRGPEGEVIDSKRRKLGAIIGDNVQTGCNSVLNPGTVLGRDSLVYPAITTDPKVYEMNSRIKARQTAR